MSSQPLLTTSPRVPLNGRSALAQAGRSLWHGNRPLAITVAISLVLIAIAGAGLLLDPRVITGAPAWMKPLKFAISVAVYAATLAWMMGFVPGRPRLAAVAGWTIALSLVLELAIIVLQVLRGTTSHFNLSTPLDGALFSTMGLMITLVWIMNVVVAVLLLRQRGLDPALGWSMRLGLLVSAIGMGVGFLMTSMPSPAQAGALESGQPLTHYGAHAVGVEDGGPGLPLVGWSTTGGDLRVGHFVGLHGLQVLPLAALALARWPRLNDRQRLGLVWTAALGYLGLIALTTWQALRGQPVIAPDALTLAAAGALIGAVVVAAVIIVRRPRA